MRILLVGGAVRDLLLGSPAAERDFLVLDAAPEEFTARFPTAKLVGKAFPVYILAGEEYAFPRSEGLTGDLLARDFTINALALDLPGYPAIPDRADPALLHAPHPDSLADLAGRVLRPASKTALADDPLRVFRASRFLARFPDFSPHPSLAGAMGEAARAGLLAGLAGERVGMEARKALRSPAPGRFLRMLDEAGCLMPWFAELVGASSIPAGPPPHHSSSVLEHTAQVMDRLAALAPANELAGWMALAHDLGKVLTPQEEWPRHLGHEERGQAAAEALGRRLALPERLAQAGRQAARLHMRAMRYPELRPGSRVDLLAAAQAAAVTRELFLLAQADHGSDHWPAASADLAAMLSVRLPADARDQGPESGRRLRELRAQALAGRRAGAKDG
ncbi:MAG: HD domain-containing protein [Thermodesulfobacteriota bacterium]